MLKHRLSVDYTSGSLIWIRSVINVKLDLNQNEQFAQKQCYYIFNQSPEK